MSDWQVGDLALVVGAKLGPGDWRCKGGPKAGCVVVIEGVIPGPGWLALVPAGYRSTHFTRGWGSESFRKIRPDEHEACEPEFVTLLKRAKHERIKEHNRMLGDFYGWPKA